MKRYQCIKNVFAFNKGGIYTEVDGPSTYEGGADLILHDGRIYEINKVDMSDNFQELLDLDVDAVYNDQEHLEYAMLQQSSGCARTGLAICIVAAIGAGCLIYLALTWRS